ncbi:hypothetical protein DSM112329_02531 [Paraconexibacter sp. AEG42_29]|uniref:Integral membrane protein n=1 Tax=Paraconexibacter sp. AEG42_29 TaxID=2997339 RepID=A0AAU7AVF2_9ACTN
MLITVIVACEVLFWVVLLGGLAVRYLLRRPRLGGILLACAPLVDLILLTVSILDLRAGGTATTAHTLAAVYIGVSVAFGHRMVRWADVRFAHRYADGPAPTPKPRDGRARAAYERSAWLRHLLAWGVGTALMLAAVLVIDDPSRTDAFVATAKVWTLILAIDAAVAVSYTVAPKGPRPTTPLSRR